MACDTRWKLISHGVLAAVVAAIILAVQAPAFAGQTAPHEEATVTEEVTFTKDIVPILQRSCQNCHRPNAIAPMSLINYSEVRPWARAIKYRTALRGQPGAMPPWFVEKDIGIQQFQNDPSLSEEEIVKIGTWVDNGMPRGNPTDMPPPIDFLDADEWEIGEPDLIIQTASVKLAANDPDWWGPIGEVPFNLTEERYVAAVEAKEVSDLPGVIGTKGGGKIVGGRFIFHHLCWGAILGDGETRTGFPCHEVGRNADVFPPEVGRRLDPGAKAVFSSTHLHATTEDARAHVKLGFRLHPRGYKPTVEARYAGLFGNSMNLDVRPLEANQMFEAFQVLEDNAKIVSFEPHMHAAGVRMCLDAISGRTTRIETLSCVGYDHSWVRIYNYADDHAPLLPKGTILRMRGYFDNSPTNRNVADPRNWSGLGHRSIDNMMNHLGEILYMNDEDFSQEMVERRERLGIEDGALVPGCPLCGAPERLMTADGPAEAVAEAGAQQ